MRPGDWKSSSQSPPRSSRLDMQPGHAGLAVDELFAGEAVGADGRVQRRHQQRCGDSLAADVADGDADAGLLAADHAIVGLFVKDEEVVVVAADGACGTADAVQVELCDAVGVKRKEVGLDLLRDGDLVLQALLFLLLFEQSLQRSCHGVERSAQLGELIVACDADAVVEVAAVDVLGRAVEIGDRCGDGAAQPDRHPQGQQLDDEKDEAEQKDGNAKDAGDDSAERGTEELVVEQARAATDRNENVVEIAGLPVGDRFGGGEAHGNVGDVDWRGFCATDDPRSAGDGRGADGEGRLGRGGIGIACWRSSDAFEAAEPDWLRARLRCGSLR